MTNSEMIQKLETDGLSSVSDMEFIANALEENNKLKAENERLRGESQTEREWRSNTRIEMLDKKTEIEQLKAEIEQWQSTNLELVCELTRIECENKKMQDKICAIEKLYNLEKEQNKKMLEEFRTLEKLFALERQQSTKMTKAYEDLEAKVSFFLDEVFE